MEKTNRLKRIEDFQLDSDKALFESIEEFAEAIEEITGKLEGVDLEKLESLIGVDGKTPEKGKDYYTDEEIEGLEKFILDRMPKEDIDFPSKKSAEKAIKHFVAEAVSKLPLQKGDKGDPGEDGEPGKDGSPDTPKQIVQKLKTVKKNGRIGFPNIKGGTKLVKKVKENSDDIEELKDKVDKRVVAFSGGASEGGGSGNDANAIHTNEDNEFSSITEDSTPEAGSYFIYEAETGGGKLKIKFSDIGSGADGRTVLNGTVDPTSEGANGDFYINTTSWQIFGPKSGGVWGIGTDLIGDDGAQGLQGVQGIQGDTGPQGPAGNDGAQGPQGIQGPQGDTGPQGSAGADGADGADGMTDLVEDTTPQLGGDLDVNGHEIVSTSNGDITVAPHGTGKFKYGLYEVALVPVKTSAASTTSPSLVGSRDRNEYYLTALAVNATFLAPSGTPVNGNQLLIRIKDNGTARTLAWNSIYADGNNHSLPTTTVVGETMLLGFLYDSTEAKWVLRALD